MPEATMPIAVSSTDAEVGDALLWLARLPLLTEAQAGRLLDRDEVDARALLRVLRRRGLAADLSVDSPEFPEALRLSHLTDAGVDALASGLGVRPVDLQNWLPVTRAELLARLARVETAVGVADTLAMLAAELRGSPAVGGAGVRLEAAGTTHWAPHRGRPSLTPPAVEAWGRLRVGSLRAHILLAWDRASAPRAHRRTRVAGWYRADDQPGTSNPVVTPTLIICSSTGATAEWESLLDRSAERRGRGRLRYALTVVTDLTAHGPLARIWRCPGDGKQVDLSTVLDWRATASVSDWPAVTRMSGQPGHAVRSRLTTGAGNLQRWASEVGGSVASHDRLTAAEHRAVLAITLSATQKRLLIWVAHHPLLRSIDLATYVGLREVAVTALLDTLVRWSLVRTEVLHGHVNEAEPRYVLTRHGADFLAARDGVPLFCYVCEGPIAVDGLALPADNTSRNSANQGTVRLLDLRRRPMHTTGVQTFAVALAQEAARERARGRDTRVLVWLNAVEGQAWFRHEGAVEHIWPDARFRYLRDGVVSDILLEWDRGLVRRREYAREFANYAAYFERAELTDDVSFGKVVLLVVTTATALMRVRRELTAAAARCPLLGRFTRVITVEMVAEGRIMAAIERPGGGGYLRPVDAACC